MKLKCPYCGHHKWQRIPYKNDLCGHFFITCGLHNEDELIEEGCGQRYLVDYFYEPQVNISKIIPEEN